MMLKKQMGKYFLAMVCLIGVASCQSADQSKQTQSSASSAEEKDEIMKRDQIDPSNVLAIPFDDSEVEDEEEINRDEKKDVFPLPHSE